MWSKYIKLERARRLSEIFCKDFDIPYCQVYYVDVVDNDALGTYVWLDPPHLLMKENNENPIGILIHELTHHLEHWKYDGEPTKDEFHGYYYQLAKKRVISWCKRNISKKPNWNSTLKAKLDVLEMKKFSL